MLTPLSVTIALAAILPIGFFPFFPESPAEELQAEFVAVGEKVGPAVVTIITTAVYRDPYVDDFMRYFFGIPERRYLQEGLGSGVIISPEGHILTNQHVVENAREIVVRLPDGRELPAALKGSDSTYDLAVIKIESEKLPSAPLGDSAEVKIGQWALAIGNPFGAVVDNPQPSLTVGVVSALDRRISAMRGGQRRDYEGLIQTDAAINPGNSGGPLVNLKGEVIGINTAIYSTSGGYQGIGFAIPINRAKAILEDLKVGKGIERGWLGVRIQELTDELRSTFRYPHQEGVLVNEVVPGSPAGKKGIRSGDVIRLFNGSPVTRPGDLLNKVKYAPAGSDTEIEVWRDGERRVVKVTLEPWGTLKPSDAGPRSGEVTWRGLTVAELEVAGEEGREASGVMVTKVKMSSPAWKLGIRPGDIIDEVNRQPVEDLDDFQAAMAANGGALIHTSRGYVVLPAEEQ